MRTVLSSSMVAPARESFEMSWDFSVRVMGAMGRGRRAEPPPVMRTKRMSSCVSSVTFCLIFLAARIEFSSGRFPAAPSKT